jgi:hypothetical protein
MKRDCGTAIFTNEGQAGKTYHFSGITVFVEVANAGTPSVQIGGRAAAPPSAGETQLRTLSAKVALLGSSRSFIIDRLATNSESILSRPPPVRRPAPNPTSSLSDGGRAREQTVLVERFTAKGRIRHEQD